MIIAWIIWVVLALTVMILINTLELTEEILNLLVPIIIILIISAFILALITLDMIFDDKPIVSKTEQRQEPQVDSIRFYNEGYKRGQIDCQNDSLLWKKVMNDDGEIIFQKIK
jgi:hypothetical protein